MQDFSLWSDWLQIIEIDYVELELNVQNEYKLNHFVLQVKWRGQWHTLE